MFEHQTSDIKHQTSNIRHRTSDIQHQALAGISRILVLTLAREGEACSFRSHLKIRLFHLLFDK